MVNNYSTRIRHRQPDDFRDRLFDDVRRCSAMWGGALSCFWSGFSARSYRLNRRRRRTATQRYQPSCYLGLSMFFGALFGSYFGLPLPPPLWFNFEAAVEGRLYRLSAMCTGSWHMIKFGIAVIYTGLVELDQCSARTTS